MVFAPIMSWNWPSITTSESYPSLTLVLPTLSAEEAKEIVTLRQFHDRIRQIAQKPVEKAAEVLANVLDVKSSELSMSIIGEDESDPENGSE